MAKLARRIRSTVGLAKNGRIDWQLRCNQMALHLASHGMAISYIEEVTGLSEGQIYGRLRKQDIGITDVRNGRTELAQTIIAEFRVRKL